MKLNLGCGKEYREGFVNVDWNSHFKSDKVIDMDKRLPFEDNTFDYVLAKQVLSYSKDLCKLMEELHRICKPNAIIEIQVPHFKGVYGRKFIQQNYEFGIGTYDTFTKEGIIFNGNGKEETSYPYFDTLQEQLHLFVKPSALDFIFNFSRTWQIIMERIFFVGFNMISFKLRIVKTLDREKKKDV